MPNIQKMVKSTEAANDALNAIVSKALGYPRKGVHVGGGIHVPMPQTWDGQGPTPVGWTKHHLSNFVASPIDSALPIDDALASQLQAAPAQALLTLAEQTTLAAALVGRVSADLDAYIPKTLSSAVAT